ncbi:MAG: phosphoglycolate phosphatase [Limnohabitans sp.]|nr:phosphoglycolate phosphatase [Limnohabitans sp.]
MQASHHLSIHSPWDAVILDLDGTLIDTLGDFTEAVRRTFTDLGVSAVPRERVQKAVGKGSEHLLRTLLDDQADALYDQAWVRYQHHYQGINGEYADPYPGVVEGLEHLKAGGWPLACVTNKPTAFARDLLRLKGLAGYFDLVYGGDAFDRRKPDPLPLFKTCEALGTQAARTLMVGDSSNDAQAAQAAGCPLVLMRYGYNHGESVDALPAWAHLDRLDQLLARLS